MAEKGLSRNCLEIMLHFVGRWGCGVDVGRGKGVGSAKPHRLKRCEKVEKKI